MSVDIAFAKAKPPGGRRLNFHQFLRALALLSEEARQDLFYSIPTLGCYLPLAGVTASGIRAVSGAGEGGGAGGGASGQCLQPNQWPKP